MSGSHSRQEKQNGSLSSTEPVTAGTARFRDLVERITPGVLVHRHLKPLYANPAPAKLFGFESAAEVMALESVAGLLAPEEQERFRSYHEARLRGDDVPGDYVIKGKRRDGSDIWLNNRPARVDWEDGPAVCTTLLDVTDRVRADEALRQSELRIRDYAESSSDWYWEMDENLRFSFFSGRIEEIVGFDPALLIGKTRREVTSEDSDHPRWREHLADLEAHRPFRDFRYGMTTVNGDFFRISVSGKPVFDDEGVFKGYRGTGADVTERENARVALRDSEARFRDFAAAASDWFWEMDENLRFTFFSERNHEITGFDPRKYLGMTRREVAAERTDDEKWRKHFGDLDAHRPFRDFRYDLEREDGTLLRISTSGIPVIDDDGDFKGYRGVGSDITEQERAAQALRQSEARFRDFAASASDWFWEMDENLRFSYFSERSEASAAFDPSQNLGLTRLEAATEPTDNDKWRRHLADMEAHRPIRDFRYDVRNEDGTYVRISVSGTPVFDDDGVFKGYRGTGTDVTAREQAAQALRESDARLRGFIGNSPAAIFLKDREGRYITVNDTFESWYEIDRSAIVGRRALDWLPMERVEENEKVENRVIESKRVDSREMDFEMPDGKRRVITVSRFPILGEDGTVLGLGGIETDVTSMKQAETEMREAMEAAELANRAKSEFLAHMSHELRTPLNSVIGFSQMLMEEPFGRLGHENYANYAEDINTAGIHLLNVISDILDISKIEAGEMEFSESDFRISALVEAVVTMVAQRAASGAITTTAEIDADLPRLRCDEVRVKQILLNLISNAIKFTPPKGRVLVKAYLDESGSMNLEVIDTGVGIPKDQLERVLNPFEQVRESTAHSHEGTGLGLYLTNTLTEMHGGTLRIDSEVGGGTRVVVRFPADRTVQPELGF